MKHKYFKVMMAMISTMFVTGTLFAAGSFDLSVTVTANGSGVNAAKVSAITFNTNGEPDVGHSQFGQANSQGYYLFENLTEAKTYNIIATKADYYPTIKEQFESTTPLLIIGESGISQNASITLNTDTTYAAQHCQVIGSVKVDTATVGSGTLLFGGVGNEYVQGDLDFTIISVTDSVTGYATAVTENVPNYHTGQYWMGCFSPAMGVHVDTGPISINTGVTSSIYGGLLDLTSDDAEIPDATASAADSDEDPIIRGVVYDDLGNKLSNAEVHIYYGTNTWVVDHWEWQWEDFNSWTDSNGVYRIWRDLVPPSAHFEFQVRKTGYIGVSTTVYITNSEMQNTKKIDFQNTISLSAASGIINGYLYMEGKGLVPNGHVNVWGDHDSAWITNPADTTTYVRNGADGSGQDNVGSDGTFQITGLAPGDYRMEVWTDFNSDGNIIYNYGSDGTNDADTNWVDLGSNNWTEGHPWQSDDMRVNVSTSGTCEVYSSSGVYVSSYVVVNIPPSASIASSCAVSGSLEMISGTSIDSDSPIMVIAHEDWDSFSQTISTVEESGIVVDLDGPYKSIILNNNRVRNDLLPYIRSTGSSGIGNTYTREVDYWVNWDDGSGHSRIMFHNWDNMPDTGTDVSISSIAYSYEYSPISDFDTCVGTDLTYSLNLAQDKEYQIEFKSMKYGIVYGPGQRDLFDGGIDTTGQSSYVLDPVQVASAGQVTGIVKKPDGTIFKPTEKELLLDTTAQYGVRVSMHLNMEGETLDTWADTELDDDGTFTFGGLLPGTYYIKTYTNINVWSDDSSVQEQRYAEEKAKISWAEAKVKNISVKASTTPTHVIITLEEGVNLVPNVEVLEDANYVSAKNYYYGEYLFGDEDEDGDLNWLDNDYKNDDEGAGGIGIMGIAKGTNLTAEKLKTVLWDDPDVGFGYNASTVSLASGDAQWMSDGKVIPGDYDFYAGASLDYEPDSEYMRDMTVTFVSQKKGVTVDSALTNGTTQYLTMPRMEFGNCAITGKMTGTKIFNQTDMTKMQSNIEEFFALVPAIMLYDNTTGNLAGFSMEMPPTLDITAFETVLANSDLAGLYSLLSDVRYNIKFLKAGSYTAVFYSPNYPKITKQVTLTSGQTLTVNVNFDDATSEEEEIGATLVANFVNTSGSVISGVTVSMTGPGVEESYISDASGNVTIENIEKGIYYFEIEAAGYAKKAAKVSIDAYTTHVETIVLTEGTEYMFGYVYSTLFPTPVVYEGATLVAFDTTVTDDLLGLYTATTDSDGRYIMDGMIDGHVYKVWLIVPGRLIYAVEHTAGGALSGYNFLLKNLDPDYGVQYKVGTSSVTFKIAANKTMPGAPTVQYALGDLDDATWTTGTSVSVSTKTSGQNWETVIALGDVTSSTDYTLRVYGQDAYTSEAEVFTKFNLDYPNSVIQVLDEIIAQGGEVELDETGEDPSAVTVPVGAMSEISGSSIHSTEIMGLNSAGEESEKVTSYALGGFASMLFSKQSVVSAVEDMVSDIYTVTLENASLSKSVILSLSYDRDKMGDDYDEINIRRYNTTTGRWVLVEGVVSHDPLTGTVSVEVDTFASASASAADVKAMASQSGQYAVFYGIPATQGAAEANAVYTGEDFEIYNFPNPFNLESKTVSLADTGTNTSLAGQQTVKGTVLKYYLPSKYENLEIELKIYNVAGELVRTIDEGTKDGGYIYFTEWDGKNDDGSDCASGVYLLLAMIDGKTVGDAALKMAIIK